MVLVTLEKALTFQELLANGVARLGIRQYAGGIGTGEPLIRFCSTGLNNPADLPFLTLLNTICIISLRSPLFFEGELPVSLQLSRYFSGIHPPVNSCLALTDTEHIPEFLIYSLGNSQIFLFASIYDEHLLESRLIGLIREKTELRTTLSGGLVNIEGMGVVITGESGSGKTSCALELVRRGHRWVADDVVAVEKRKDGLLYGRSHGFETSLLEVKGWGIVRAEDVIAQSSIMSESRIDCIMELVEEVNADKNRESGKPSKVLKNIMGVDLPCVSIRASRDASCPVAEMESCIRTLQRLRR